MTRLMRAIARTVAPWALTVAVAGTALAIDSGPEKAPTLAPAPVYVDTGTQPAGNEPLAAPVNVPPPDQVAIPGDCASWFGTAMRAGWDWNTWPTLVWIMGYRSGPGNAGFGESGCDPSAARLHGRDRSYGLMMLNTKGRLWDHPIAWGYPSLKDLCGLASREQLLDGFTNLRCARLLYEVHLAVYGDGWRPW